MNNIDIKIYPVNKTAETLMNLYPPVLANKFLPEWYKKQDSYKRGDINTSSVFDAWGHRQGRKCPAIQEVITQGIVIPAWTDVNIVKNENTFKWTVGQAVYSDEDGGDINYQSFHQIKGMNLNTIEGYGILKFISPYTFIIIVPNTSALPLLILLTIVESEPVLSFSSTSAFCVTAFTVGTPT